MSDTDETIIERTLGFELPEIGGVMPVGVVTSVTGSGQRIGRPIEFEERGVLVIEYECQGVGVKHTKDGPKLHQALSVKDLYEMEGRGGKKLLRGLREAYRLSDDARHGRRGFDENMDPSAPGVEVTIDGSGVLVTPGERGALAELGLPDVDAAVLVFGDGSRGLWPDDWPDASGVRPSAGSLVVRPGVKNAEPEPVRQILDVDTGETVEEWTDEQENERLEELEAAALEREAAEDAAAVAELEAGRGNGPDGKPGEPWDGYADLKMTEITARLGTLDADEARRVVAFEEAHKGRKRIIDLSQRRIEVLTSGDDS